MVNPFDDHEALFLALQNSQSQVSLWPAFLDAPAGWRVIAGPAARAEIIACIEKASAQDQTHE